MSDTGQNGASWGSRLVGGIQVIGGGLEIALGVGGIVLPEPATTVGGVILIAHGADTVVAGFRTLWHGELQHSYTQQLGTAATTMPVLLAPQGAPRPVIVAPPR